MTSTLEERRARFDDREPSARRRRQSSRRINATDYDDYVGRPRERSYSRRSPSRRRDSFDSYTPIDPYASYIPPPPYFLPSVLRQSSIYGSQPPPPPPQPARPYHGYNSASHGTPYSPAYYEQFWDTPNGFPREPPEEESDGVQVDFSALWSVRDVTEKTAASLLPSVDAVTLVCANVSRVLYLRTDDLQSKSGASTAEIETTAAELSNFAMVLGNLREILESTSEVISDKAFDNMNALLVYCKKALQKIQSVITTSRKTPSKLNFLKRNSLNSSLSKAKPVRLNLECLKTSLTAMMSTILLADRQNERRDNDPNSHNLAGSLETPSNDRDTDGGSETFKTTYELDAAVERITLKLEDDIFANSRAVRRWQDAERREFDDLYIRTIIPDTLSPISPASQWISSLVPFQPSTAYMKRIAGPIPPKAISYGNAEVVASGSALGFSEEGEEEQIASVIQGLLTKWTGNPLGTVAPGNLNQNSAISKSPEIVEMLRKNISEGEEIPTLDGDGALGNGISKTLHNSKGSQPVVKRMKHVSFQDAEMGDRDTRDPERPLTGYKPRQDSEQLNGYSMKSTPADVEAESNTLDMDNSSDIGHRDNEKRNGKKPVRQINDLRKTHVEDYHSSVDSENDALDHLPKTGWEQADDIRHSFSFPDLRRSSPFHGPYRPQFIGPELDYYQTPQVLRSVAPMVPYEVPYGNSQDTTKMNSYSLATDYLSPPAPASDEEEPRRHRGFAETIYSSSENPSRSYSRQSQSERYRAHGRYPERRDNVSRRYSNSEEEPIIPEDERKALVLRGNPLSSVLQQLQTDLQEAMASNERKNTELKKSTDAARMGRLEKDLEAALENQKEIQAASERKAVADERNSAAKSGQIDSLEADKATQAEQIADLEVNLLAADTKITSLEARITRRDAAIKRLKRKDTEETDEPLEEGFVEVIEEADDVDDKAALRHRAPSEFSYYTSSDRRSMPDKTWQLAQAIILLLSLACGVSAVLAGYIHSNNGDVMREVLSMLPQHTPEFTLQGQHPSQMS